MSPYLEIEHTAQGTMITINMGNSSQAIMFSEKKDALDFAIRLLEKAGFIAY
jgi:hypothetical protein